MHNTRLLRCLLLLICLAALVCLLAAGPAPERVAARGMLSSVFSGEPSWGADFRLIVEPPAQRPLLTSDDQPIRVLEKNVSIAVSPIHTDLVIAGYETSGRDDTHSRFATSTDAGITWQGGSFGSLYPGDIEAFSDVRVDFDAQGTAYYTTLGLGSFNNGYMVFTSTNGLTWGDPSAISLGTYEQYRFLADLAVDRRTPGSGPFAGSVYFASPLYQSINPNAAGIMLKYSRDSGASWSPDVQISDPDNNDSYAPSLKVASDGTIYAGFTEMRYASIKNPQKLFLDRSTDGGQTWSTDRLITGAPITTMGEPDYEYRELAIVVNENCDLLRINHYTVIGVSPTDPNTVYVVWNDGRWEPPVDHCGHTNVHHGDIAFSRTTDAGLTWSPVARLNDDPVANGVDQWQPTLEVAPDGTIGVTWYDRRYDPAHYNYDTVYSQSTDGGLTWSANSRVSDVSSDPNQLFDVKVISDVGFRKGLVFGPDYAISSWIDTRGETTKGYIYADRGAVVANPPTITPTITSTGTSTATAQATATATATVCAVSFADVPEGSTFYPYVHCMACMGIINGYPDNTFRPNNNVTRGQLAKIVSNSAGFNDPPGTQTFEDVPPGSTFYTFTQRLAGRNVMSGYPCGGPGEPCGSGNLPYFRPNANATRGQISKIVAQAAGLTDPAGTQIFEDVPPGSTFYDYIQRLASRSIMSGYPCGGPGEPCGVSNLPYFRPAANATRGQSAKIVTNTFFPDCNPQQ
ncbi:MAG: S-layer homology domain-containing protein [Chloroflexota bacterium]